MIDLPGVETLVRKLLMILLLIAPVGSAAGPLVDAIKAFELEELQPVFGAEKVARLLDGYGHQLTEPEARAAAILIVLNVIEPEDLRNDQKLRIKLGQYERMLVEKPYRLMGRVGDAALLINLARPFNYERLQDKEFIATLTRGLASGVITGYDIRPRSYFDRYSPGFTLTYSHSSVQHLKQLVTLMASEGIKAWVFQAPKVAAFRFREDWGEPSDRVRTLAPGIRVVEGQELVVLFHFEMPDDRYRFHELILEYAKKDEENEPGLLADSWWQPFYYSYSPMEGFETISIVVLSDARRVATLTVPSSKAKGVMAAFEDSGLSIRHDRVWVNPAFYRFLHGGYK